MIELKYREVKAAVLAKKYRWFGDPFNMNMVFIRHPLRDQSKDAFDDTGVIAWIDDQGNERSFCYPVTVDPGLYYLQKPMGANGCAIMLPGQYLGSHALGLHKGRKALIQVKPVLVYRDNDRDVLLDEPDWLEATPEIVGAMTGQASGYDSMRRIHRGMFGINIHGMLSDMSKRIGQGSAGCTVIRSQADDRYRLDLVALQKKYLGTSAMSYTLLRAKEVVK